MNRLYALVPGLLAAMLAWELFSGRIFLYISDRTLWLIALSIPVFALMALVQLRAPLHGRALRSYLLIVPVVLAVVVPALPLTSAAVDVKLPSSSGRGATNWDGSTQLVRATADQHWDLMQLGLLRLEDSNLAGVSGGRADLLGFVYRPDGQGLQSDQFFVARFLIRCCTADAIALTFPVHYPTASALSRDTWVEVQGPIMRGGFGGSESRYVEAEVVNPVPQPERPYLVP